MAARLKKYTGILSKPHESDLLFCGYDSSSASALFSFGNNEEFIKKANEKDREAFVKRMAELFNFFEIDRHDEDAWMKMAIALAYRHVPGFRVRYVCDRKPGQPKKWDVIFEGRLYAEVQKYIRRKGSNGNRRLVSEACNHLATKPEYAKISRTKEQRKATLERRYRTVAKRIKEPLSEEMLNRLLQTFAGQSGIY